MKNETVCATRPAHRSRGSHRRQDGIVLLALVLVVLVGSSWVLLGKLNQRAQDFARTAQTQAALRQAKDALIRYAVNYPETHADSSRNPGPGYLPCPDQDPGDDLLPGDADAEDHREDMVGQTNCGEAAGTTVGRLPTRDLGLDNLVDAAGERLWYAVAQEFHLNQSAGHVLNSATPASLRVDGDDDEIVAVVIAPGAAITGQDGRGDAVADMYNAPPSRTLTWREVVAEYLEDDNATNGDGSFVTGPTAADSPPQCTDGSLDDDQLEQQCFNDKVIAITRRELLAAVEARVANDARGALEGYRIAAGGAYPWLAPFTDPKRGGRYGGGLGGYGVSGRHTADAGSATVLTDTGARFLTLGVAIGDRIWNVSDGSWGTITAVTDDEVTVAGLNGGEQNDFDQQDLYFIESAALDPVAPFTGSAAGGSSGAVLVAAADLQELGVVPGDVVDRIAGGAVTASATVEAIDGESLELDAATGIDFQSGDTYRVRSPFGTVTGAVNSTTILEDTSVRFTTDLGVDPDDPDSPGFVVLNLTDGSWAAVVSVNVDEDELTVDTLLGGAENDFDTGDRYALVRHLPEMDQRFGLLPLHEMGKPFVTDFSVKWSLLSSNGHTVSVSAPGAVSTYTTAVTNWIQRSTLYSDEPTGDGSYPDAVPADADVKCLWAGVNVAHCRGSFNDTEFMRADVDSFSVSGSIISITDTGARFQYAGVRQGAKVRNLSQAGLADGIVHAASSATQNLINVVTVDDFNPPFTVAEGDDIRVYVASKRTPTVGAVPSYYTANSSSVPGKVCATGANFWSFIGTGDTIRLTTTGTGNPVGMIENAPEADCVTYTDLQGGLTSSIAVGQRFRIQYDFVEERRWTFNVRMSGDVALGNAAPGVRQRSICQGFGSDCGTQNADPVHVADNATPVVQFQDFDQNGNTLGTASVTVPVVTDNGDSDCDAPLERCGSLVIGGLNLLLAEDADEVTDAGFLPRWYLRNRWHEYAFASYSDALSPGNVVSSTDNCSAGADCLTVTKDASAIVHADRKAVVVMAGTQLASQDRGSGELVAYFEGENVDADISATFDYSIFSQADPGATFNDRLSVVLPCPAPDEYKSWPDCD